MPNRSSQPHLVMPAALAALAYGLGAELVFQQLSDALIGTLSISFLLLTPAALGALTVALGPYDLKRSWGYAIFAPWLVCTLAALAVLLFGLELWACIVIALPIFFVLSSLGGALVCFLYRRKDEREARQRNTQNTTLGLLLAAPFLLLPLEAQLSPPSQTRMVHTQIAVAAGPAAVWNALIAVPEIQPEEERFAWFRVLGLPDPVEAMLAGQGVGAMRQARYDNGLQVVEPVLVWEPETRYRFTVELDPASLPSPLWRAVDGEHLNVLYVEYRVEPQPAGGVLLYLDSTYRLTTPLNPYAALWGDFLLSDFQHYILEIVKHRAEQAG